MITEHHNYRIAHRAQHANQPVKKCFPAIIEQSLGSSHAARSSRGEDNTGNHFNSACNFSLAKIDFESDRQSDSGARRSAIISATTEIAISSGVSAPISSPIGANTLLNISRGKPSFSSSCTTEIVFRLLPII